MIVFVGLVLAANPGCGRRSADGIGQRFLDALNTHDPVQVAALLTSQATYTEPGRSAPLDADALSEQLTQQWQRWHDQVYSARAIHELPDVTVIEWESHQTNHNRDAITLNGVFVLDVRHGRIAGVRNYFDVAPLLRFMRPAAS
jgi:limonene-1,2-epoxide hydrolase